MAAHNSVNREPCHGSKWLLTNLLREQVGCGDCLVGSDFYDVAYLPMFGVSTNINESAVISCEAGLDQDMGSPAYATLLHSIETGKVNETCIDRAAGNVLRAKFATGLFEEPMADPSRIGVINSRPHRDLALEVAVDSITLLKNSGQLPIPPQRARQLRVAILGPNAGCGEGTEAGQMCDAHANAGGNYWPINGYSATQMVTLLAAARASGAFADVRYARGAEIDRVEVNHTQQREAVALARASDLVVLVLGDSGASCGEGHDRQTLDLPGTQLPLLRAVLNATGGGTSIVVVTMTGRTAAFGAGDDGSPEVAPPYPGIRTGNAPLRDPRVSLLSAFLPGQQAGPAILAVIRGAEPGGRLAQPWPRSAGQIHSRAAPWFNLREGDCDECLPPPVTELFCFGGGMSYGNVSFGGVELDRGSVGAGGAVTATVRVRDLAHRARAAQHAAPRKAVVQVYFAQTSASRVARYQLQLGGFAKALLPVDGSAVAVPVRVRARDLGYHYTDHAGGVPRFENRGAYTLWACYSSCDCPGGFARSRWNSYLPRGGARLVVE